MQEIQVIVFLLAVIILLAEIADRFNLPYPILLVVVGIVIALIPGLPSVELHPEIIFLIFLPPVLYAAAWNTSWQEFVAARRPIALLSIGCVLFTTTAVAVVAHNFLPNFSWALAFVLGAVVSPPDAVAATASTKGLNIPRRVITVLEGESLVNDATALIAYRYAVAAVVTGVFVFWEAAGQFLLVASAGILVGVAVGFLIGFIHKITPTNPTVETSLTFITPYISYLGAEALHVSGVLAVVTTGLYLSRRSSELFSPQARIYAYATWDTVIFLLNGVIFLFIGLELRKILQELNEFTVYELISYGALISLTVIAGRILWVYPGAYIPRFLSRKIRERETITNWRTVTVVAWTGMRGIVSLASALALPLTLADGETAFPNRSLILFLTFCVIVSTLVLQGVTLRPLIKWLEIQPDGTLAREEQETRLLVTNKIIKHIEENLSYGVTSDEILGQIKSKYEIRFAQLLNQDESNQSSRFDDEQVKQFHEIQRELTALERRVLLDLRRENKIDDEVLKRLEHELDLEEEKLAAERQVQ